MDPDLNTMKYLILLQYLAMCQVSCYSLVGGGEQNRSVVPIPGEPPFYLGVLYLMHVKQTT